MNITIFKSANEQIVCKIDISRKEINVDKLKEFLDVLEKSEFLLRIEKKTGLKWKEKYLKIEFSEEADYKDLNTVLVDYNRGNRAISSVIHEVLHLLLRQYRWTEEPVVKRLIDRYPELSKSSLRGAGYKIEQMFAYLLQNEVYQEIAKDLNFDASKNLWDMKFFKETVIPSEYNSQFLENISFCILEVWYSSNRSKNIFQLIEEMEMNVEGRE